MFEDYIALNSVCEGTTINYDKVGGSGGGGGGPKDSNLAVVADMVERIKRYRAELTGAEEKIKSLAAALPNRDRDLVYFRYVLRLSWSDTQKAMQSKGHDCGTQRTLFYWNQRALKRAEKIWEETYAVANERATEDRD